MKKYIVILVAMLAFTGCLQENELGNGTPLAKGLQVSADFIDLGASKDIQEAGLLTVSSKENEVKVKWISDSSFNIDTTQTVIEMKDGRGVLPIKWQSKLENGSYAPENVLFKAGIVLTSGEDVKYIPLYNVQRLDSVKIMEKIRTRTVVPIADKAPSIEFKPTEVEMNENGASLLIKLNNMEEAYVNYDNIKNMYNIDKSSEYLPKTLTTRISHLIFNWKDENVRPAAFEVPIIFYAFELDHELTISLKWIPERPDMSVNPISHSVAYTGGKVASIITCNTAWTATKGTEDWFSMDKTSGSGSGTIEFTISANNDTKNGRTANVTVTAGSVVRQIVISQVAGIK